MVPSASLDVDPLTEVCRNVSLCVKAAVGAWLGGGAFTVTGLDTLPVSPSLSVTVRVTV